MSNSVDTERQVTLLEEIDSRQNELLDELDELNAQVLALLDQCTRHNVKSEDRELVASDDLNDSVQGNANALGDAESPNRDGVHGQDDAHGQSDVQGEVPLPEAA